jgi:DNA (cytosine-5)-methyltransferase 1
MGRIPATNTQPEVIFRKALRRAGVRSFRVCDVDLPGKPDIVIPGKRLAIFIDGDFWHGNQYKLRGFDSLDQQLFSIRNATYWTTKISRNVERDFKNTTVLVGAGWRVLRFWESDVYIDLQSCVLQTLSAIAQTNKRKTHDFGALPRRTVVELFAGIGLIRQALEAANWDTVFANDNDPQKHEMYAANFGADRFDQRSICELKGNEIPSATLLTASFPCNDLSLAGNRNGLNGSQSGTFWEVIRILREMKSRKPPLILLENVFGFLTSHNGKDFEAALSALNDLGYSCDAFVLDAARFVPQSRVRMFVVATPQKPSPTSAVALTPSLIRPKQLVTFVREHPHLGWNIRSLPEPIATDRKLADILEDLRDSDPHWWNQQRAEYFLNQLSERHLKIARAMMAGNEYSFGTAFRRIRHGRSMAELRIDGVAGCLRTPRGGSGRQILFKAGKGDYKVRLLTARECARLQGVKDDFKISVPLNQALFGFGDAVCVPVVRWIAENYLTPAASELMRGPLLEIQRS